METEQLTKLALAEIAEEDGRKAIDAEKVRLRTKVSVWHKIFPWKITVSRR